MSEKLARKMGKGNYYLLVFVVAFILFYVLQLGFMVLGIAYTEIQNPGFASGFQVAVLEGKPLTDLMWAIQNISQFAGEFILAIIMIIFLRKDLANSWLEFKSNWKSNLLTIIFGFVIIYLLNYAMVLIYDLLGVSGTSENQETIISSLESSTAILMVLTVMLLAPFVEEILFRKLLYGVIEVKFRLKPIFAVIISAIIFSALHAVDIFFFQYFTMALVLCTTYALSKNNIYVPIGIHFLNNASIAFYFIIMVL
ncbi:MAG: CPBP family intramembrane metalloprotease [Bacilli bacterium]|nr:CPBP family intramembrane metalloprotease [Bacilli bacterium]